MSSVTKKKKKKKKVVKKAAKKVSTFSLDDLTTELKGFKSTVLSDDNAVEEAPYKIPFRNKALQKITGGIIGGKFAEIAGESQSGKSFLGYELMAECQAMGGFCSLNDGEGAFEKSYGKMVGMNLGNGTISLTKIMDINKIFAYWYKLVKAIRAKKRKAPILLLQDSFPCFQTSMSLENMGTGTPLGYEAMQRNQAFSREIEKFVEFLGNTDTTLIILNQFTKKTGAGKYEFAYQSLCEEKMQYWATQRIRGVLRGNITKTLKIDGADRKIKTGVRSEWTTIKNRAVKPFQKATTDITYTKGMKEYSGLYGLLLDDEILVTGTSKLVAGEEEKAKAVKIAKLNPKFFDAAEMGNMARVKMGTKWVLPTSDLKKLVAAKPDLLTPIWTGTYDDGEESEMVVEEVGDVEIEVQVEE